MKRGKIMGTGLLIALVSIGVVSVAVTDTPRPLASQIQAMDRLEHWIGEWEGSGWAATGRDQRIEFSVTESVQRRLHGSVLLVEGRGTKRLESGEEVVTHEAVGILSFDPENERYNWRTYDLRGGQRDTELTLTEDGASWEFRDERGARLRFAIKVDGQRWHETGEISMDDGENWYPMLDMTLVRTGATPP